MMEVEGPMSDDENRNLFAEDERELEEESNNPEDYAVEVPATQLGTQDGNMTANLDVSAVVKPKRVIKNPQPKLNPERLMGPRGLLALGEEFKDWKPRGDGHEFQDLDQILSKLNHWTHRLYPKLPFDASLNIIENRLGNKKAVSTYVKKIRMDMAVPVREETNDDDQPNNVDVDVGEDEVERYGEEPSQPSAEEEFENMTSSTQTQRSQTQSNTTTLSDEQLERMRRNKEMAAQKKREREEKKRREQEDMNSVTAEDIVEAERELAATATASNNRDDLELQLDEEEDLMREMEENQREMEETRTRLDNIDTAETLDTEAEKKDTEETLDAEAPPAAGEWSQEKEKSASSPRRDIEPEPEKNPTSELVNIDQIMEDMDDE